jgi:adenine phosphoribosyltransferase
MGNMAAINSQLIRSIHDFPKPGIIFKDITPLLSDASSFSAIAEKFANLANNSDYIVGIEARGFILAAAAAVEARKGFIPLRKSGKLPGPVAKQKYALEYGQAQMEIHDDIYLKNSNVLIIDDVLASGGTAIAAVELCQQVGLNVSTLAFLLEIPVLGGRSQITKQFPELQITVLLAE